MVKEKQQIVLSMVLLLVSLISIEGKQLSEVILQTFDDDIVVLAQNEIYSTNGNTIPADIEEGAFMRVRLVLTPEDNANPNTRIAFKLERRVAPDWVLICGHTNWADGGLIDSETGELFRPLCGAGVTSITALGPVKKNWRIRSTVQPLSHAMTVRVITELVRLE